MRSYLIVIRWRDLQWVLRAQADLPAALKGLASHFGSTHPLSLKVLAK